MKISLQLTDRDKRLLVILGVVLLVAVGWQFFLKDVTARYWTLRDQTIRLESRVDDSQRYGEVLASKKAIREGREEEVNGLLKHYFPAVSADYYIDLVVREAGADLVVNAINTAGTEQRSLIFARAASREQVGALGDAARNFQSLTQELDAPLSSTPIELATGIISSTEILFGFSSTQYPAFSAYLQRLINRPEQIIVRNITMNARDGMLSGTFTLVFPAIPSIDGDLSQYRTPTNAGIGRADAFVY